jgi:hypothetical protein
MDENRTVDQIYNATVVDSVYEASNALRGAWIKSYFWAHGAYEQVFPGDFVYLNPPAGENVEKDFDELDREGARLMLVTKDTPNSRKRYGQYNIGRVKSTLVVTNY